MVRAKGWLALATYLLIRDKKHREDSCMYKKTLIPVIITALLATGCSSEAGANDDPTNDSAPIAASSSQSSSNRMLSAKEAEEQLHLDEWINTRIRQSDDGITTWMPEWQILDAANTLVEKREYLIDGSINFSYRYHYDSAGQLTSTEKYNSSSEWLEAVSYFYDNNGFLIEEDKMESIVSPTKTYYENDPDGNVISERTYTYPNGESMFLSREVFRDGHGNPISTTEYSKPYGEETVQSFRCTKTYDKNNRIVEDITEFEQSVRNTTYEYAADGLTRQVFLNGDYDSTETLDEVGNIVSLEKNNGVRMERRYNSFSQMTYEKYTDEDGLTDSEKFYEYDDHGLKVAEWLSSTTSGGKRSIRARTFDYVNTKTWEIIETPDVTALYKRYPPMQYSENESSSIELSSLVGH